MREPEAMLFGIIKYFFECLRRRHYQTDRTFDSAERMKIDFPEIRDGIDGKAPREESPSSKIGGRCLAIRKIRFNRFIIPFGRVHAFVGSRTGKHQFEGFAVRSGKGPAVHYSNVGGHTYAVKGSTAADYSVFYELIVLGFRVASSPISPGGFDVFLRTHFETVEPIAGMRFGKNEFPPDHASSAVVHNVLVKRVSRIEIFLFPVSIFIFHNRVILYGRSTRITVYADIPETSGIRVYFNIRIPKFFGHLNGETNAVGIRSEKRAGKIGGSTGIIQKTELIRRIFGFVTLPSPNPRLIGRDYAGRRERRKNVRAASGRGSDTIII
jgi:hypothetical protein